MTTKKVNQGENIAFWRKFRQMSQSDLAQLIPNSNQMKISRLEEMETIDDKSLEEIAKALNIPVYLLKDIDHQSTINKFITYYNTVNEGGTLNQADSQIVNPLDKVSELYDKLIEKEKEVARKDLIIQQLKHEAEMNQLKNRL